MIPNTSRSATPPPAAANPVRPASSYPASSVSGSPFPPPASGEVILVIDDEPSVRNLLTLILTNHGYEVVGASDALQGFQLFSANPDRFSLIVSDVHMPHVSGRSFADLIRPIRPDVRILLMSGLHGSGPEVPPGESRDPFLLKPFKPTTLLDKIHRLLHPEARPGS